MKFPVFPPEGSEVARQTDYLFWGLTVLSGLMLLLIALTIGFFVLKYRRGKKADRTPVDLPELKMEIGWTIAPAL